MVKLAIGLTLILLAWWCGPQGYGDLHEYAQITDRLWNHGTFALPDGSQSRFCWGFPVLLLPFYSIGRVVEFLCQRDNLAHWVTSAVPLLSAMMCGCLIVRFAGLRKSYARDGIIAATLTVLSASTLYHSRMLNLEPVVGLLLMAGVIIAESELGLLKALSAGSLLGIAFACHYANGPGIGVLALGLVVRIWFRGSWSHAVLFSVSAFSWVVLTGFSNEMRYGTLGSGYSRSESVGLTTKDFWLNLPQLLIVILAVPWLPFAFVGPLLKARLAKFFPPNLELLILAAIVVQVLVWLGTWQFHVFPLRYLTPWILFAGFLLPGAIEKVRHWAPRLHEGIINRAFAIFIVWGFLAFLGWKDFCRPLSIDNEDRWFPGQVVMATWYQPRGPYREVAPYVWAMPAPQPDGVFYPQRPLTILSACCGVILLLSGCFFLMKAVGAKCSLRDVSLPGGSE